MYSAVVSAAAWCSGEERSPLSLTTQEPHIVCVLLVDPKKCGPGGEGGAPKEGSLA